MSSTIEEKYSNFKKFLLGFAMDAGYKIAVETMPLEAFLYGIQQNKDKDVTEISTQLAGKANIDLTKISEDEKYKFTRYVEFWKQIAEVY